MATKSNQEKDKNQENPEVEQISLLDYCNEQLQLLQNKTGIRGVYVLIFIIISVLFVLFGFMERLITNLVGTLYPAFKTIKSIEEKSNEDKQWLSYWIIFGIFTIIDMFSGFILKLIPLYFFLKIIFLLWCFMPNTQGSIIMYNLIVVRLFKRVEKDIDSATNSFKSEFAKIVGTEPDEDNKKKKKKNK